MTDPNYHLLPRSSSDSERDARFTVHKRRSKGVSYLRTCIHLPCKLLRQLRSRRVLYVIVPLLLLIFGTALFNPSYTSPPSFVHPQDENVYIAANILDENLVLGAWGDAVIKLAQKFEPGRVYVSVYGGPISAMEDLDMRLEEHGIERTVVSEELDRINVTALDHVIAPNGESMVKRIEYLAEVRNRALEPLKTLPKRYHKVLFLNDVVFSADEALRLMFSTNAEPVSNPDRAGAVDMRTNYRAACAMDYINPFKFYDTYATRDTAGYYPGVPIFPYFTNAGPGISQKDMLKQKEAVRVKSCWGGMVSYDGRFLQSLPVPEPSPGSPTVAEVDEPEMHHRNETKEQYDAWLVDMYGAEAAATWELIRFRSEPHPLWDASECCLINADVSRVAPDPKDPDGADVGIYINPYVRVAYDSTTLKYLWVAKRLERLLILPQRIISWWAGLPKLNTRRHEIFNASYPTRIWVPANTDSNLGQHLGTEMWDEARWDATIGHYVNGTRIADRGGFCGVRQLLVHKEHPAEGEKNWEKLPIPPAQEGIDS